MTSKCHDSKSGVKKIKRLISEKFSNTIKRNLIISLVIPVLFVANYFIFNLRPLSDIPTPQSISISPGTGFNEITEQLKDSGLIRNPLVFKAFAFFTGSAGQIKPGYYELSPHWSGAKIIKQLVEGGQEEVTVTIFEGSTIFEIDETLSNAGITKEGEIVNFKSNTPLEGRLFPDTYKFFIGSEPDIVIHKFLTNFEEKVVPILGKNPDKFEENLILASIVEKEVPFYGDRQIVAGILKKREKIGMALQVDASVCYIKALHNPLENNGCWPLTKLDLKIDSPYNTYLYKGWPPGPISSPGLSAVQSVIEAKSSPYWFYISDPETHNTVFAETLDEHLENISIYLRH
ncbi:MAG: endolytic transglycosylase MltG [bacterium]|nr:endolytic transglycosylase MltG [bacterium]